jgi:hypothetical protein
VSRGGRIILFAILTVAALVVLHSAARALYFGPRATLQGGIERSRTNLSNIRTAARRHIELKSELQEHADRTLGASREEVEAALRARLNRIAEDVAIAAPSVSTSQPRAAPSPMERADLRDNPLREEPDFVELEATISGEGSLAQAVELVDRIEAAPWIKRIDSVGVDPKDGGERFALSVRLTTVFLPTLPPDSEIAVALAADEPYSGAGAQALRDIVERNPFRVPPAPPVAEATPEPPPPPQPEAPAPYEYGQWRVTMITEGSRGREVWLSNSSSNESRSLTEGESIRELLLVAVEPDRAEFQLGEERFAVEVGSNLADRKAIKEE